jgi:3'(2'), 5'-bisphosphate nucleotidase
VADYSAQAIVNTILSHAFPDDPIVSEEDAGDLRKESGTLLRDRALELANAALIGELSLGENAEWGIGPGHAMAAEELLNAIDRGNHSGGPSGRE